MSQQAQELKQAGQIFERLQDDIQIHLIEEYIKPQLRGDDLVIEFEKQLMSIECQRLDWRVLFDVVEKIIKNKEALAQMFEKYHYIGFKSCYNQHFIQKNWLQDLSRSLSMDFDQYECRLLYP